MTNLAEERAFLTSFRNKLMDRKNLSADDLVEMCTYLEDTIELAAVSIKMVDRLRINYMNLQNSLSKN